MKLGAQLFSIRTHMQSAKDIGESFRKLRAIGYENVQLSGAAWIPAEKQREICEESGLPIVCTHVAFDRIVNDTATVIHEHQIFNCPVIGLGMMPKEFRKTREGLDAFLKRLADPIRQIRDAGLAFGYHNHAFEFMPFEDGSGDNAYDLMLEQLDWNFIMDTYWVEFAGKSAIEYIQKIGSLRLPNIHFKDMANDENRSICACGNGVLDFASIFEACQRVGVQNVLVEQDNAVNAPDAFAEMASSFTHLRPIIR